MAEISKIKLPNNETYDIKDATARSMIGNNGTFVIAWNGTGTPTAANIPAGIVANDVTGTLAASADTLKKFYLVHSSTQQNPTLSDIYDEYVTVDNGDGANPRYTWEKIGDTQIKLSEVVTGVSLDKKTTNFVTGYSSPTTANVIGASSTFTVTQPTITVTPTTTYMKVTTSGGSVATNSKDEKTAVTGYSSTTSDTFIKSLTVTKSKKLATTTVTGVSGSTTASKVSSDTSQTTAKGTGTTSTSTDAWLKGWSVSDGLLTIGGVTMDTQTTTQIKIDTASVTVPQAASSSTTVATGALTDAGSNDAAKIIVTDVAANETDSALTGLGTPTTAKVLGSSATFTLTRPSVSLGTENSSATGRVQVAIGITSAEATGGNVAWNSKDQKTALTGLGSPTTSAGLNSNTDVVVTKAT